MVILWKKYMSGYLMSLWMFQVLRIYRVPLILKPQMTNQGKIRTICHLHDVRINWEMKLLLSSIVNDSEMMNFANRNSKKYKNASMRSLSNVKNGIKIEKSTKKKRKR